MERVNATSFRWTMDAAGDWLCIQTGKARQVLDALKEGKSYDVEIREHREKRSLDANAYFWVLADRLAEELRIPKTEIYRRYIREIGGNNETVCIPDKGVDKLRREWERNGDGWLTSTMPSKLPGCTNVVLYYGSSTYDTAQMSRLIDMAVQDCVDQGIETLPPEKMAGMMEEWGR